LSETVVIRGLGKDELAANIDRFVAVAGDVPGEYWTAENFLRELPEKWTLSLAAWHGEIPVGYAILSRRPSGAVHLHHFMIAAGARDHGLGGRLLAAALARCREQSCPEVTLKVATDSVAAQRFYLRHGFADEGREGDYRKMRRSMPVTVAIHQPNYVPWLGYFAKMARSDVFVFLDDVQFSKNSYINRVQIDGSGSPRWLTVPVTYKFGDPINRVRASGSGWPRAHLDTLKTYYAKAASFGVVWDWLGDILPVVDSGNLAAANETFIRAIAQRLGLRCAFRRASEFDNGGRTGDDRLIALLKAAGPSVSYLSGKGGGNYQDPAKFERASIGLGYVDFVHPTYDQGHEFLPGLSILDALFRVGFERTAALLAPQAGP
jgi:ribosomal protein S18 acetylase RimI-like enzyme